MARINRRALSTNELLLFIDGNNVILGNVSKKKILANQMILQQSRKSGKNPYKSTRNPLHFNSQIILNDAERAQEKLKRYLARKRM